MGRGLQIFLTVVGVLLLLPGACFSLFGIFGGTGDGPGLLGIGVVILTVAGVLLYAGLAKRK